MFNVICVDNSYSPFLTPNEMYFVEEENETHYKMHNDAEKLFWYDKNLFKKVQDKQKIKVVCINTGQHIHLTVGKYYELICEDDTHYQVTNDNGITYYYRKEYFSGEGGTKLVVCIRNTGLSNITLGRVYRVDEYNTDNYYLVDDEKNKVVISKCCFVAVPLTNTPVKPPLGLIPRKIYWEELNYCRRQDIIAAMQRRMEAKMDIPVEWCKELIDLVIANSEGKSNE